MHQILFVDDDRNVLESLRRSLRDMRFEWDMLFAGSAQEGLEIAAQRLLDAVVSDIMMPGMDGAQFLEEMARRYPSTARVALSGYSDQRLVLRTVRHAHQYLNKPCDPNSLRRLLQRVFALRALLGDLRLRQVVSGIGALPSPPDSYLALERLLSSPDVSLREVRDLIARDPAMTARLLQVVNSAFFGLSQRISDIGTAVNLLGLDILRALVLAVGVFQRFEVLPQATGFSLERLWRHSLAVGRLARTIAELEGADPVVLADCMAGGLLHDIGQLIMVADLGEAWERARALEIQRGLQGHNAEVVALGAHHAAVGAYLLGLWGLPDPVVEAVAFHHGPLDLPHREFIPLTAVHVANALLGDHHDLALDYLRGLGLAHRLEAWGEAAREWLS